MESATRRKKAALTYALLLWIARLISAQTSMLALWYGRRCYERSKGEMVTAMYEKTLSRKIIVSLEKHDGTEAPPGHVPNVTASETPSKPQANAVNASSGSANGAADKHKESRAKKLELFKDLFFGRKQATTQAKGPATTGQVLNLVRSDAFEIAQRFLEIERLVKTPFGIVFAVWLIWILLGPSCLLAILVVVVAHVLNGFIARSQVRWRRRKKEATDARLQVNSQYIDIIRHLRWYGWHETWLAQVMAARERELNIRLVSMFLNIVVYFISVSANSIFPVAAFFAYTALAGKPLRIDLIFPALQLFGNLQGRLREIPHLIATLVNAYVAMGRIEDFMKEPEKPDMRGSASNTSPLTKAIFLKLNSCSFAWPGTSAPILRDVSLVIEQGLTVVYGKIGSGKTALLQGLLGEMDQLSGEADIPNEVIGYCSQTPWLQSTSIRDNILFFSQYEKERYEEILDACELRPDLANFKDGDRTRIGEK
jgi:ABC-type multidrug transport system fused ATPase/permease subunit